MPSLFTLSSSAFRWPASRDRQWETGVRYQFARAGRSEKVQKVNTDAYSTRLCRADGCKRFHWSGGYERSQHSFFDFEIHRAGYPCQSSLRGHNHSNDIAIRLPQNHAGGVMPSSLLSANGYWRIEVRVFCYLTLATAAV
jgi:hypothetical protein